MHTFPGTETSHSRRTRLDPDFAAVPAESSFQQPIANGKFLYLPNDKFWVRGVTAFADVPFRKGFPWPRISVIVCSYNGSRTIRDCFNSLLTLDYPNFEVIVVNDGSTDSTTAIAHEYGFRVISTENRGLSHARNMGLDAATGEIVAYIDDDAYPDRHWLSYLGSMFMTTSHAGSAGPMFLPAGMGPSRSASPTPPAARSTSCLPIRKRSTSPAVIWPSAGPAARPPAGLILSSAGPGMTSIALSRGPFVDSSRAAVRP